MAGRTRNGDSGTSGKNRNQRVAVVYHFFAHYREGIVKQLLCSPNHTYFMAANPTTLEPSIKAWDYSPEYDDRFIPLPCVRPHPRIMYQKGIVRLALRRDIDTIIYLGNAEWPGTWLSALIARLAGKRVLFWTHGWKKKDTGIKRLFRATFYKIAHGLLLYGHHAKMIAIQEGFDPDRLYVIYNSLEYDAQKHAREQVTNEHILEVRRTLFDNPDRPMVICTSRLSPGRRFDQLFSALNLLKEQGHMVNLLLVGDGAERSNLEALAKRDSLPVHFYGACYDEKELAKMLMAANVTVAPGDIGLTALHSLAFGVPAITHNDGDHQGPEWEAISPGITGDLFNRGDIDGLARVIKQWTGSVLPSDTARASCYKMIERFYTPHFQRLAIDRAVSGERADDLFWQKETPSNSAKVAGCG